MPEVHCIVLLDQARSSIDFLLLSQSVEMNESHSCREASHLLQWCHSCTANLYTNHHTNNFTVDLNTSVASVRLNWYKTAYKLMYQLRSLLFYLGLKLSRLKRLSVRPSVIIIQSFLKIL